jgi:hypothetical protein
VDTMDQVLALALERPLPELSVTGAQPMAPPLTAPAPDQPSAHQ